MTTAEMSIESLFNAYAAASLSGDPHRTAAFYADTFIAAGPQGSAAFPNDERFLEWLGAVHEANRQTGMSSMQVISVAAQPLSVRHQLVTVGWGATFEKTGDRLIAFNIAYLLEKADDGWKILAFVSEKDQDAEMRRLGLL